MQQISEATPPEGGWVITACDCSGTVRELQREDEHAPWRCPCCGKSVAQMFGLTEEAA
jgi:PHP family Zn ribbon phosphoesterase